MNGKPRAWALAFIVGVLLLGGVAGAAIDRTLIRETAVAATGSRCGDARDQRRSYLDWLSTELALTEEQRAQVEVIVEQHREQVSALWRETRPRFEELKSQVRADIREVLNEEQQVNYQALLEKQSERHRHTP
jgi:Spy/CpxP family protein refolding chaperone